MPTVSDVVKVSGSILSRIAAVTRGREIKSAFVLALIFAVFDGVVDNGQRFKPALDSNIVLANYSDIFKVFCNLCRCRA